ncbi:MAG: PocR ligand-binding domain-containing protein, partial [Candidatus Riflebacteria bacterium]|nr:PocR ligand-binding domain-containing protein [Candidatus Riflebacteria bacterium]
MDEKPALSSLLMSVNDEISFEDLFNIDDIQKLQDDFARATGVATIITRPDGTPITRPINFTRLCRDIIRKTPEGCANCYKSDATIGRICLTGPIIQTCAIGGLWDAGAGITVGGKHLANWLIGQIRNEAQSEESMRSYARKIGVDEELFIEAFLEVPSMPLEQFERIAQMLFTLAKQLSTLAYQNLQKARFISERKQANQNLLRQRERLQFLIDGSRLGTWEWNIQTNRTVFNETWAQINGYTLEELPPHCFETWERMVHPEDLARVKQVLADCVNNNAPYYECEYRMQHKDGHWIWVMDRGKLMTRDNEGKPLLMFGTHADISGSKKAEEEKEKLQAQLYQSQKMESIGRLAGGIAHDFNNMLGAILGYTELSLEELTPSEKLFSHLQEIRKAAQRSVELTRQLLAFARKQTVAPRVLDLNETVEGMLKMLRRLIGEDISLAWLPAANLGLVKIDPSQLDQILANLCVNARDAIAATGKVTIETSEATLDERFCLANPGASPGQYVVLAVHDSGCGMSQEAISHLFEPFFTTKEKGKGTGLGLATIYGIVKQNNGCILVSSTPGHGTTFRIYLPKQPAVTEQAQ